MSFNADLRDLLEAGINEIIKQPSLDSVSQEIGLDKKFCLLTNKALETTFNLQMDQLRLSGLHSMFICRDPEFDWNTKQFKAGIGIRQLLICVDNFSLQSVYRIMSKSMKPFRDGPLSLEIKNIQLELSGKLDVDFVQSRVAVTDAEAVFDFNSICWLNKINPLVKIVTPVLAPVIKKVLSKQICSRLIPELNSRLQAGLSDQQELIGQFARAYHIKLEQGGWNQCPLALQGFGGIGQYPLPTLWNIPEVDASLPRLALQDVMEDARTGDLVLFSGSIPSSMRIKRMTQSPYSHVVLLVKEPELAEGRCLAWQATASEHCCVLRNMETATGVQLNYLEDVVADYLDEAPGSVVVYRKLMQNGRRAALNGNIRQNILDFIKAMDGKPYTDDMDLLYIMGLFEVENPGHENYYCAGLVAESLMEMGVLDRSFLQHQYTPRDFCTLQKCLPHINEFSYNESDIIVDI
ncbi:hypothetical protein [Maridesulfovibrio sp.]|uniref:hypothetical protein n=1 Tax=Maridesulfovibrio sp. TaxID=2795000 RepID=UPI0029CA4BAF|nr:hypothetical protein [Maridesulfovibrio sp.]